MSGVTHYKTLKLEAAEHIATITFTRQQTLNRITPEFMDELGTAVEQLAHAPETRALILTGSGRGFCCGRDPGLLGQMGGGMPPEDLRGLIRHWQEICTSLENLPQVTLAAINGETMGGGVELVLCCDFRIASTRAVFGLPEVKMGIIPDLGGLTRLARTVGPAWTKEIALRARNFNAMEALRVGLVNRVAEPGDLMGTARNWAEQFARLPTPAVRHAKRLINSAFETDLATALKQAEEAQVELTASDEFRAAIQAAREETQTPG